MVGGADHVQRDLVGRALEEHDAGELVEHRRLEALVRLAGDVDEADVGLGERRTALAVDDRDERVADRLAETEQAGVEHRRGRRWRSACRVRCTWCPWHPTRRGPKPWRLRAAAIGERSIGPVRLCTSGAGVGRRRRLLRFDDQVLDRDRAADERTSRGWRRAPRSACRRCYADPRAVRWTARARSRVRGARRRVRDRAPRGC